MNRTLAIALIALSLPLAGCGNKGPLVLPTKPAAEAPIEPAPADVTTPEVTPPATPEPPTEPEPTPPPPPTDDDRNG